MTAEMFALPRLVPIGFRPLAALLVSAGYGLMLVRMPAPMPAAVSLTPAEVMILPPGDPRQELASVGSPNSTAIQASEGLEAAHVVEPAEAPVEELRPTLEQVREIIPETATQAMAMLQAQPPLEEMESAVAIPRQSETTDNIYEPKSLPPAPVKRKAIPTKEVKKIDQRKMPDRKKEVEKQRSASSPARRGQTGAGGGQSNASGQSVAAYASHVRSVLVAQTQRIRNLRSTGRVGLTFKINSSGRLVSLQMQTSGSSDIDRAVHAALQNVTFPPPPGGQFSASITITVR